MRLLSKREVDRKQLDVENILQGKLNALRQAVTKETAELNLLDERLKAERELVASEIAATRADAETITASLKQEVLSLEARKAEALKPITEHRKALLSLETALRERETALEQGKYQQEAKEAVIAQSYEDIADRLAYAKSVQTEAENKLELARLQSEVVEGQSLAFQKRMAAYAIWVEEKNREITSRAEQLLLLEDDLKKTKEWLVLERMAISKEQKALDSQRITLTTAFAEARNKGII